MNIFPLYSKDKFVQYEEFLDSMKNVFIFCACQPFSIWCNTFLCLKFSSTPHKAISFENGRNCFSIPLKKRNLQWCRISVSQKCILKVEGCPNTNLERVHVICSHVPSLFRESVHWVHYQWIEAAHITRPHMCSRMGTIEMRLTSIKVKIQFFFFFFKEPTLGLIPCRVVVVLWLEWILERAN